MRLVLRADILSRNFFWFSGSKRIDRNLRGFLVVEFSYVRGVKIGCMEMDWYTSMRWTGGLQIDVHRRSLKTFLLQYLHELQSVYWLSICDGSCEPVPENTFTVFLGII